MIGAADHGREGHILWHTGVTPPGRIPGPTLRQIQGAINQGIALGAGVSEKDPDLAVLDPARRARVLPLHAHRFGAFLHKAGLIQHQNRPGVTQVLDDIGLQVIADRVRVPAHPAEEVLHGIRCAVARGFSQLPAVFALHRRQQATQISHGAPPWLHPAKAWCNPSTYAIEFPSPISHVLLKRHRHLPLPADLNT